MKLKDLILCQR